MMPKIALCLHRITSSNLVCRRTSQRQSIWDGYQEKVFCGRGEQPLRRIKCFRSNDERGPVFICFQTGILLLMEKRLRSVSGGYKCSSKTWLCRTIHKLYALQEILATQVQRKSKNQWENKLSQFTMWLQHITFYIIHFRCFDSEPLMGSSCFGKLATSSSEFLGGILALAINICGCGCQKIW